EHADECGVDGLDLADLPQVRGQAPRLKDVTIFPAHADGLAARAGQHGDDGLVRAAAEHHLDDVHRLAVGHAQPVDETTLQAQPLQESCDLGAAAVHEHGIHPCPLEQHEVFDERALILCSEHTPAELHDDTLPLPGVNIGE